VSLYPESHLTGSYFDTHRHYSILIVDLSLALLFGAVTTDVVYEFLHELAFG
jgi:hypothetical protein